MRKWLDIIMEAGRAVPFNPDIADDEEAQQEERDRIASERYEREDRIQKTIARFLREEVGLDLTGSYNPSYSLDDNELHFSTDEITLDQLAKLRVLGDPKDIRISGASREWELSVTIQCHDGLSVK